ncbi:hypothetical protein GGQ08_001484 [Salinibacter ruber]|nr:hypothetical protein [Salinibacter ruber]MCS3653444.1 hypothetical protein [Salinibacter ruber]
MGGRLEATKETMDLVGVPVYCSSVAVYDFSVWLDYVGARDCFFPQRRWHLIGHVHRHRKASLLSKPANSLYVFLRREHNTYPSPGPFVERVEASDLFDAGETPGGPFVRHDRPASERFEADTVAAGRAGGCLRHGLEHPSAKNAPVAFQRCRSAGRFPYPERSPFRRVRSPGRDTAPGGAGRTEVPDLESEWRAPDCATEAVPLGTK